MSRRFTDPYGRRWRVDAHRAENGRLEFTASPPRQASRIARRFLLGALTIDGLVYLLVATLVEGQEALDAALAAAVTGLVIGTVLAGLVTGLSALRILRAAPDPLVFSAPFALRADLSDAELSQAVRAAEQMRDHPTDTGPIEIRAGIAHRIRSEGPTDRLAR